MCGCLTSSLTRDRYGIAAMVVGVFVKDYILSKQDVILTPDYRPSFYFTIASSLVCVVAVLFIRWDDEYEVPLITTPAQIPVYKNKRLLALFGTVFCLGMCHNMIQNFLLWWVFLINVMIMSMMNLIYQFFTSLTVLQVFGRFERLPHLYGHCCANGTSQWNSILLLRRACYKIIWSHPYHGQCLYCVCFQVLPYKDLR